MEADVADASKGIETLAIQPRDSFPLKNTTISSLCKQCMECYQKLWDILHQVTTERGREHGFDRDISLAIVEDAKTRFKAWAVNIAALHKAHLQSSLDFRLKEATEIRQRILKVLSNLEESLGSAISIASGEEPNESWESGAISDSEEEDPSFPVDVIMTSDLEELFTAIRTSNSSLMKMTMVIRNSPARDDYLKAASRYKFDPRWDIGHVKEKHGSAKRHEDWLLERLGKAITRRRQFLKYRQEHHSKLARDWDEVPGPTETKPEEQPASTIASGALTKFTKATTFIENVEISAPQVVMHASSDTGGSFGSQTSYEATVAGEMAGIKLTVPPHPQMAFEGVPFEFGEPFQCPYCYTEQTVKNRAAWKKHVFRDLKPYVCTFRKCDLRMFKSRNEWFAHEIQAHRREWTCPHCQTAAFSKTSSFTAHLSVIHHIILEGSQLKALVLQSEEPVDKIALSACKLCDEWETDLLDSKHYVKRLFLNDGKEVEPYGTLKQFRRHLGHHMEQLALFALPINGGEVMEDDSASSDKDIDDDSEEEPQLISTTNFRDGIYDEEEALIWDKETSKGKISGDAVTNSTQSHYSRSIASSPGEAKDALPSLHETTCTIKCICDYENSDGYIVLCKKCDTWQHVECYYLGETGLVEEDDFEHFCSDCEPRFLDRNKANERQVELREIEANRHNNFQKSAETDMSEEGRAIGSSEQYLMKDSSPNDQFPPPPTGPGHIVQQTSIVPAQNSSVPLYNPQAYSQHQFGRPGDFDSDGAPHSEPQKLSPQSTAGKLTKRLTEMFSTKDGMPSENTISSQPIASLAESITRPSEYGDADSDRAHSIIATSPTLEPDLRIRQSLSDLSAEDDDAREAWLVRMREEKLRKRRSPGSVQKRGLAQSIGSDTDEEDIQLVFEDINEAGSRARRSRRGNPDGERRSLIFDHSPPRIEEVNDPESAEESTEEIRGQIFDREEKAAITEGAEIAKKQIRSEKLKDKATAEKNDKAEQKAAAIQAEFDEHSFDLDKYSDGLVAKGAVETTSESQQKEMSRIRTEQERDMMDSMTKSVLEDLADGNTPLTLQAASDPEGSRRPKLQEILANTAPPPWTLSSFMGFLSQNHCLETLEFTIDVKMYTTHFTTMVGGNTLTSIPPTSVDCEYTRMLWQKLMDAYIQPNGPREISFPSDVRNRLLALRFDIPHYPPNPEALYEPLKLIYELMEESLLEPFIKSVRPSPIAKQKTFQFSNTTAADFSEQ